MTPFMLAYQAHKVRKWAKATEALRAYRADMRKWFLDSYMLDSQAWRFVYGSGK